MLNQDPNSIIVRCHFSSNCECEEHAAKDCGYLFRGEIVIVRKSRCTITRLMIRSWLWTMVVPSNALVSTLEKDRHVDDLG
jgi:hypothetical protein